MRVEWLPEAQRGLVAQLEWVAERDPWAAVDLGEAVHVAVGRLVDHPAMGWPGRVAGTRELVVTGAPYVVVYQLEAAAVVVLRVLHSVQRWPGQ